MQFTSAIVAILAVAVAATPAAKRNEDCSTGKAQSQCTKGQTISCCEKGKALVGANCSPLTISSILPISSVCQDNNVVACCDGTQTGLINVNLACIPVNVAVL